jgi:two-component system sensor histidine kinase CpxA
MGRMRSLFVKIFFCFLVIIAIVGTTLETSSFLARFYEERWQAVLHSIMPMEAEKAARMYEQSGKDALRVYLDDLQTHKSVRFYFFDEDGNPLLDRNAPPIVMRVATNKAALFRAAQQNLSLVVPREGLAVRLVAGPSGKFYSLAFQQSPSTLVPVSDAIGGHPYLRLLAVALFGVALCFVLTRHITKPLGQLRKAAGSIAAGQLKTRVSPVLGRRHDEIATLGRDFDRMAEQIEALVTAQRNLLGDVSHELRSPLARLIVAVSLLHQEPGDEAQEYLNRIGLEANRLDKLIGQLLILTRIESGVETSLRERFDLGNLVQEVVADGDFEGRAHNRSVRIMSAEPCLMVGVSETMRSAIENVIRNAVRHTREGTTVEVTLQKKNGYLSTNGNSTAAQSKALAQLRVRDYGPGVPDELLSEIFQPFRRAVHSQKPGLFHDDSDSENNETQLGDGAGLGLAIADRALRMHEGTIKAFNAMDSGLIIEIEVPLAG